MEDYKLRMINEYKELKGKYDRLHRMLVKYDAGKLDFTPTTKPDKPKQERMVTRTVSYAKGEEVYYSILYGFSRQDVLEKLYHYEQEEEEKAK